MIRQLPRIPRSADSSNVAPALRWTPPIPPVANTRMPAREASSAVAATVVPPVVPCAIATGRSLALSFTRPRARQTLELIGLEADVSDPVEDRDRRGHRAALGDRPLELERCAKLSGRGSPWVMIVDRAQRPAPRHGARRRPPRRRRPCCRCVTSTAHGAVIMSAWSRARRGEGAQPLSICTIGDLILDVIVLPDAPARGRCRHARDDSARRRRPGRERGRVGGALGASSRLICARGTDVPSELAAAELARHGVEICGPVVRAVAGSSSRFAMPTAERTMASDRGVASQLHPSELDPSWVQSCDVLHVSGYCLLREPMAEAAIEAARLARRVTVDLASAHDIEIVGAGRFTARLAAVGPDLVFATEAERAAVPGVRHELGDQAGRAGRELPRRPVSGPVGRCARHHRRRGCARGRVPGRGAGARDRGGGAVRRAGRRDATLTPSWLRKPARRIAPMGRCLREERRQTSIRSSGGC